MTLGTLLAEERELMFRSLALTGVHVVVSLNNFKISEQDLSDQEVKEIHLKDHLQVLTERMDGLNFKFKGIADGWKVFAPSHLVLHHTAFSGSFAEKDIVQLNMAYKNTSAGSMAFITYVNDGWIVFFTDKQDEVRIREREAIDHLIYVSSNNSFKDFNRP